MDKQFISELNHEELAKILKDFISKNASTNAFPLLNKHDLRKKIWQKLFYLLSEDNYSAIHFDCLSVIRILSRENTDLDNIISEERVDLLLCKGGLNDSSDLNAQNVSIASESLKCLCNIIFNSPVASAICSNNECIEYILKSLPTFRTADFPQDVLLFTIRIMFLVTAMCSETRSKLTDHLDELTALLDFYRKGTDVLKASQVGILCEILKVLFNATVDLDDQENDTNDYSHLVNVLHYLLTCKVQDADKNLELQAHVINLFTNLPSNVLKQLISEENAASSSEFNYKGYNMEAAYALLAFLKTKLEEKLDIHNQEHLLSPILSLLVKCVRGDRTFRKFFRAEVLPPLKDVHKPPEEGGEIRNYLCRLLTTPLTTVRDLTADFLFVLCKENVGRMIKYTGYGNAAGLFAQRGLLGGKTPENVSYSSDSESDTDEYTQHLHQINPITGYCERSHPDPTAHMTEEQKEYEAMKLVNLIEDLSSKGVIQPCRIGEDGKPQPLDHILQLQEGLRSLQVEKPQK